MEVTIKLVIDDPDEGNTIFVNISDSRPEYIKEYGTLGAHVYDYRFSAKSDDSADWLSEALESVKDSIQNGYHTFE